MVGKGEGQARCNFWFKRMRLQKTFSLLLSLAMLCSAVSLPEALATMRIEQRQDMVSRASAYPRSSESTARALDPEQLFIPSQLGEVVERFNPEPDGTRRQRLVIHLQDLHAHEGAQRVLGELVDALRTSTQVSLVGLEGGVGPGDTGFFSAFPEEETNHLLAELFLKKGLFTGPVHYGVTHSGSVRLYGVEDGSVYREHVSVYQEVHAKKTKAAPHLAELSAVLSDLTGQLYSKELLALDAKAKAF